MKTPTKIKKKMGTCQGIVQTLNRPWLWLYLFIPLLVLPTFVMAAPPSKIKEIHIITPQWEGQTNKDGTGLFFDIARAVYGPSGISLKFGFSPWKRCQAMVTSGGADAMFCVWQTQARQEKQLIPQYPIYVERTVAVFKKASFISWQGIHSLDYKRAVWLRGYNYHLHNKFQGIQLASWHEVDSHKNAWRQLNLDRFDVYIDALIDINQYMKTNQVDTALYQKQVLWSDKSYVAFSDTEKSRELIRIYDKQIMVLFESGELARIYKKWDQPFYPGYWQN